MITETYPDSCGVKHRNLFRAMVYPCCGSGCGGKLKF